MPLIYPLRLCNNLRIYSGRGFTLIEVMVVLVIVAGLASMAISRIGGRNNEAKAVLRELTNLSKELHVRAKLQGSIYRIVVDMKDGQPESAQSYWVEKSDKGMLMGKDEEANAREADYAAERDSKAAAPDKGFAVDKTVLKNPRKVPSGMSFEQVELSRLEQPVTSGKAYIHYLPQGLVDEAAIHIKGEKNVKWTISIHPLTGKAELISRAVSLREMKAQ